MKLEEQLKQLEAEGRVHSISKQPGAIFFTSKWGQRYCFGGWHPEYPQRLVAKLDAEDAKRAEQA